MFTKPKIKKNSLSDVNKENSFIAKCELLYKHFTVSKLLKSKYSSHTDSMYRDDVPSLHNWILEFQTECGFIVKYNVEVHTYRIHDNQVSRINGNNSPVIYNLPYDKFITYHDSIKFRQIEENLMNFLFSIE